MTDRELLELAAKAAWLLPAPEGMEVGEGGPMSKGGLVFAGNDQCIDWNPLTDDGDLQRLLVACSIDLRFDDIERVVEARHQHTTYGEHEEYGSDKNAATRRAGVRAAAAIGEKMP